MVDEETGEKIPWEPGLVSKGGKKVWVEVISKCPRCSGERRFLAPADLWHHRHHLDHRLWPGGWATYENQMTEHFDGTSSTS
jgi:hypothetical protein